MLGWVVRNFLKGCLVTFPVFGALFLVWTGLSSLDGWVQQRAPVHLPTGSGLGLALMLLTTVGFVASNVVGRAIVARVEWVFERLPLVRLIYGALRDLMSAVVGEKGGFDRPVAVALGEVTVLGFLTRPERENGPLAGRVGVYLPQSYNFAGNLIFVRPEQVTPLAMSGSEVMTLIVSGGVSETRSDLGS